jgi:hypothetical protein
MTGESTAVLSRTEQFGQDTVKVADHGGPRPSAGSVFDPQKSQRPR